MSSATPSDADSRPSGLREGRAVAELSVADVGAFTISHVATIGRAPDSTIVINLRSVSRHHARIFLEGGHFWIKDLESANGTCVNDARIALQQLADGDRIVFGEVRASFRLASPGLDEVPGPSADAPPDGTARARIRELEAALDALRRETEARDEDYLKLFQQLDNLRVENENLRRELRQYRGTSGSMAGTSTAVLEASGTDGEVERLRRLVEQLERALADSNLRLRGLQERLDREK